VLLNKEADRTLLQSAHNMFIPIYKVSSNFI